MGMEVSLPGNHWTWPQIQNAMRSFDPPAVLKMADGLLVFPDEEPQPDWKELRLGFPSGMITLRRESGALKLVTWGQISPELEGARSRLQQLLSQPA